MSQAEFSSLFNIRGVSFEVCDVETTGLEPEKDKIVELAIVTCTLDGIQNSRSWLFNPGMPIPASASAIHHIVDEDVADRPQFESSYLETGSYGPIVNVFHNAELDGAFLNPKYPALCTMRLAQKLWPDFESHSNQFLRYQLKLNPPIERNAPIHRALPDAIVTATLLIHELNEVISRSREPDTIDIRKLIHWVNEPMLLTTVRFGKHKGRKWSEVPKDYLQWILRSMEDADRDVIHTAKTFLNQR